MKFLMGATDEAHSALIPVVIAVCWIAAHAAPALAQDYRVISYQNTVNGLVSRWAAAEITLQGKLAPVLKELEESRQTGTPPTQTRRGSPS